MAIELVAEPGGTTPGLVTNLVSDLVRAQRLLTGSARLAAKLANTECYWDGGPAGGKHNRYEEAGYQVWRDLVGRWHTAKPDGTEIEWVRGAPVPVG